MAGKIISITEFERASPPTPPIYVPVGALFKRRRKYRILNVLNSPTRADGIIIRLNGSATNFTIHKYMAATTIVSAPNEFIILRGVLETKILVGEFYFLKVYILSNDSIVICGNDDTTTEDPEDGGDGIKVKVPWP